ncbi:MAG: serine hydrolase [Salinivirgaceae bacterium]|jgi:beta-N-acetylhexosaminidase|nr:serine hydrolase [Salinivirgaceae bacterium]
MTRPTAFYSKLLPLLIIFTLTTSTNLRAINPTFDTTYHWVDSVFKSLTLEQRIAQLIMVDAYSNKGSAHEKYIEKLVRQYNIGGIIFFQGGPVRQATLTNRYQQAAKTPIMIAMDAEWGLAMRLDSVAPFPRQMMLGAMSNNGLIYDMGTAVAKQCRRLGVHVNFAPVVDVNNNSQNPVINSRSFGENKHNVLRKSFAYMQGMIDNRMIVTAKHFPGHGDTDADSHHNLPVLNHSKERLHSIELFPYKYLIKLGLNGIMVAHLQVNALDNRPNNPSSISYPTITTLLKEQMGYQGLIFTDALNMRGVADYYSPGQLEIKALQAGNDVLLYPENAETSIKAIAAAVRNGELKESIINTRCKRVLAAKYWLGLDQKQYVETKNLIADLNPAKTDELNHWFAREAITLIKNTSNHIPFNNQALKKLAVVTLGSGESNMFHLRMNDYTSPDYFYLSTHPTENEIARINHQLKNYDNCIIAVQRTSNSPYRKYNVNPSLVSAVKQFSQNKNASLVYFGNPYALQMLEGTANYRSILVTYHDTEYTRDYAAQILMGGQPAKGKLPVSIDMHKAGSGYKTSKTRLGFVHPDMVGANSSTLLQADAIAHEAIRKKATPGCVVLAARNGNVFYHKSFGHHTYDENKTVSKSAIYDLASVTKVAATMPALMYFYDRNQLDLDKTIGDYLDLPENSNTGSRKLLDALIHQARLKAWFPFYRKMIDSTHTFKPRFFATEKSDRFNIHVAQNVYASHDAVDTLFHILDTLPLLEKKKYTYSDIGYYYYYKIVEKLSNQSFDEFLDETFYSPMGCGTTGFNPLNRHSISEIVPTEHDTIFRKQTINGYVHDPGAAILGGVCGHAGLFSSALDLAKVGQLFLNGGKYGSETFISKSTIDLFTKASFTSQDNRRGIGFDKPEYRKNYIGPTFWGIPLESYGHSGFTGTYLWCDPESGILYVFLSNRIHPDAANRMLIRDDIRTRIHKVFYNAINSELEQEQSNNES